MLVVNNTTTKHSEVTMSNNKQSMTPKEKADELYVGYWYLTNDSRIAKQCAIIAVNEILNINCVDKDVELSDYWKEVKQEIENNEQQ